MLDITGLPLEVAQQLLVESGITHDAITLVETAPPRTGRATGPWRVLCCRTVAENTAATTHLELIVAREQLREQTAEASQDAPTEAPAEA